VIDSDQIIQELRRVAVRDKDGRLFVRFCVAVKLIGCKAPAVQTWEARGLIHPLRFSVPRSPAAPMGRVVALPLDELLVCVRRYTRRADVAWTALEDQVLERWVGLRPLESIARSLGRSPAAVQIRMTKLGMRQLEVQGWWSPADIARVAGRTSSAVRMWCRVWDLPCRRLPRVAINPAQFVVWIEQQPRIWRLLSEPAKRRVEQLRACVGKAVAA
jgi:hypothetical protein